MSLSIEEYAEEFAQDVHARVAASGTIFADAFFDVCTDILIDAGEIEEAERAFHQSDRGIRVDGYGGDPRIADDRLTLFVLDWLGDGLENLTQTDMERHFRRLEKFVSEARTGSISTRLDESNPVWYLANLIRTRWSGIRSVRFVILTNRTLSQRVDGKASGTIDDIPVSYSVWDLGRFHRFTSSTRERDTLEIDFVRDFGRGIPALEVPVPGSDYAAYLAAIPADILSEIYSRWGARLLEQNVRVYLQARSKVNRGILTTVSDEPHMFFAYNNGISATAGSVSVESGSGGLAITAIQDLQIVNGAQTTASLHRASRQSDVSQITVQMKLSVIEPDQIDIAVPKISRYANSQNRISDADFFSNHPFHVRIEEMSRRMFAPSPEGAFQETRWFYERARGQYQARKAELSGAERRKFEIQHPRGQMFTKTDLAKFVNVWRQVPHTVSQGAQKNFKAFADHISGEWDKDKDRFGEQYFRDLVAKALVFRATERLVSGASWYAGGYRANIVAYTISKVAHLIESAGRVPAFQKIWEKQSVPLGLESLLLRVGELASGMLTEPPTESTSNISEWAKKPACWEAMKAIEVPGADVRLISTSRQEAAAARKSERTDSRMMRGIEAQTFVFNLGPEIWQAALEWGRARRALSVRELDILGLCAEIPGRFPTERQCEIAVGALVRLQTEHGCTIAEREVQASALG